MTVKLPRFCAVSKMNESFSEPSGMVLEMKIHLNSRYFGGDIMLNFVEKYCPAGSNCHHNHAGFFILSLTLSELHNQTVRKSLLQFLFLAVAV